MSGIGMFIIGVCGMCDDCPSYLKRLPRSWKGVSCAVLLDVMLGGLGRSSEQSRTQDSKRANDPARNRASTQ